MVNFYLDSKRVLIISIVLLLVATGSLIYYYNNEVEDLNLKILDLNNAMNADLKDLRRDLSGDISSLDKNLTTEIDLVDNNLESFKVENAGELKNLNTLIDEIEEQTEIQLGELKADLKSIKVQSKDFTAIISDVIQSVVSVGTNLGLGSGVVIDNDGFIVTNYHVVEGARFIRISTYDEDVYDATLIGFDDVTDVAVLKVDITLPDLDFDDSDEVEVGERVIALGNPVGLSFTVTEGIVSAVHRTGPNGLDIYLQTDVPINPGNSGGPLININSRIVGLNNFKIGGFEGLGFAIESNTVETVADGIIAQYLQQE